ncbi:MAG: DUF2752 domain-containing protein [Paludibacteraceae bacterium]|nr:DUF2752 domain-containing protein [Paludibacteraceae bacterium]
MKKIVIVGLVFVVFVLLGSVYFFVDPSKSFMPRCPFYSLTGYLCPGCGAQRAVHSLLHLNFVQAFQFNPLLVLSIPYIMVGGLVFLLDKGNEFVLWLRLNLFGRSAIYVWGGLIVVYWIFRNL